MESILVRCRFNKLLESDKFNGVNIDKDYFPNMCVESIINFFIRNLSNEKEILWTIR